MLQILGVVRFETLFHDPKEPAMTPPWPQKQNASTMKSRPLKHEIPIHPTHVLLHNGNLPHPPPPSPHLPLPGSIVHLCRTGQRLTNIPPSPAQFFNHPFEFRFIPNFVLAALYLGEDVGGKFDDFEGEGGGVEQGEGGVQEGELGYGGDEAEVDVADR